MIVEGPADSMTNLAVVDSKTDAVEADLRIDEVAEDSVVEDLALRTDLAVVDSVDLEKRDALMTEETEDSEATEADLRIATDPEAVEEDLEDLVGLAVRQPMMAGAMIPEVGALAAAMITATVPRAMDPEALPEEEGAAARACASLSRRESARVELVADSLTIAVLLVDPDIKVSRLLVSSRSDNVICSRVCSVTVSVGSSFSARDESGRI
jgi:hypothetical protein